MSTPESVTVPSSSTLSAEEFHLRLLKLYRVGNRLRREFAEVLRELADSRLFQALGFSDISQSPSATSTSSAPRPTSGSARRESSSSFPG